jgi:hypothetical protein
VGGEGTDAARVRRNSFKHNRHRQLHTQTKITRNQDGWLGFSPPTLDELVRHIVIPFGGGGERFGRSIYSTLKGDRRTADTRTQKNGSTGYERSLPDLSKVTCEQASLRLVGYLRWVTAQMHQEEELYYGLRARRIALVVLLS